MNLTVDISWPANIPLPVVEYGGKPRNATISSPTESPKMERRSRFQTSYGNISVGWMLSDAQYDAFKDFFEETLNLGTSLFKIELRYPKNSELTFWVVRFVTGHQAEHNEGNWSITAELDLFLPYELPEVASVIGFESFMVIDDDSSGAGYQEFVTSDGFRFDVEE